MADHLNADDDVEVHFTFQWLTCSCCAGHWVTDPDKVSNYNHSLDQEHLDDWEKEVWQQMENIWKVRQAHIPSPMLSPFRPTMELAWDAAIIKARLLGIAWRGRELPDHAIGNEMQAELARILDWFEDITDHVSDHNHEENQDILSSIFFEEYVKLTCKKCEHVDDPLTFHKAEYCSEWCYEHREDD